MAAAKGEAARQAVREGDVDAVRACLEGGIEANLANPNTGRTLLHIACRQGYPAVASLLLSNGANPGATTLRRLTPLHLACYQGHLKVARILLEAWAPVDGRDEAGTAPLHLSAQMGHTEVVRLLLQCGADKDALDELGWTPIFFASWNGHAAVSRMLLQAGANARVADRRDEITPLHLACCWGKLEAAKVLLEFGADSSAKDCNGAFPEGVIGAGSPDAVDPACARQLSEIVVGHRLRIKGASSSLECVVDSLRSKVCELEDQLRRSGRDRLEAMAYSSDENHSTFLAALKPECPVCQVEAKEAVLDPCRHLAACASCADSLQSCTLCGSAVRGYQLLESRQVYQHTLALEDEGAGLRAQLKRFSRRVRDLIAENGDLKLDVRRARAEILVLTAERRGLEGRFLLRTPSPPSAPDEVETADTATGNSIAGLAGGDAEKTRGRLTLTDVKSSSESTAGDRDVSGKEWRRQPGVMLSGGGPSAGAVLDEPEFVVRDRTLPKNGVDLSGRRDRHVCATGNGHVGSAESGRSELPAEEANSHLMPGGVGASSDDGLLKTGVESGAEFLKTSGQDGEHDSQNCASPHRIVDSRDARWHPSKVASDSDDDNRGGGQRKLGGLAEVKGGAGGGEQCAAAFGAVGNPLDLEVVRLRKSGCDFSSGSLKPTGACSGSIKDLSGASMADSGKSTAAMRPASLPRPLSVAGGGGHAVTSARTSRPDLSNSGNHEAAGRAVYPASDDEKWSDGTIICEIKSEMWPSDSGFVAAKPCAAGISSGDNASATSDRASGSGQEVIVGIDLPPRETSSTSVTHRQRGSDTAIINYFLDESSRSSSSSRSPGG